MKPAAIGAIAISLGFVADQVAKLGLLYGYGIEARQPLELLPILDIVLVWNRGVSYGLFAQDSTLGRWVLIAGTAIVAILLGVWMARTRSRLTALGLGLVISGALGNGVDRLVHKAVVDFLFFHVGDFRWYVFNLADVWIVAGVAALLYESLREGRKNAAIGG